MSPLRLDRLLSESGWGSRTDVRDLVRSGHVTQDGVPIRDPSRKVPETDWDRLAVDGHPLKVRRSIHLMLHKPAGIVTAMEDARLPCLLPLVPAPLRTRGLSPAGRLDRDTTGLLLLTNDGLLLHRLTSPAWHVDKVYEVSVVPDTAFGQDEIDRFDRGLILDDGTSCRPALLVPMGPGLARVTLREGRFHQVKRMMAAIGRTVAALHRTAMGPLALDPALSPGGVRELTQGEIAALYASAGLPAPQGIGEAAGVGDAAGSGVGDGNSVGI